MRSRVLAACLSTCFISLPHYAHGQGDNTPLVFPGANSRVTYFTLHNIAAAQEISRGSGVRVGILDHGFGLEGHRDLYADGVDFRGNDALSAYAEHGYWMALVLREIAPDVEIYALNTWSRDETEKVDAMIAAIDWAVANDIDVLTYSAQRFTEENRGRLDEAVDRAIENGIVTTFIHYPHPNNLLPTGLIGMTGDDEREPDVNILHYDYTVVFPEWYREAQQGKTRPGWRPFLSISSTSPVTAGIVAMMLSADPSLTPRECKEILMTTGRPIEFERSSAPRAVDAAAAVRKALKIRH